MGTVWKATHTRLKQPVAVKFISRDEITVTLAQRFVREGRATASVRHRNVVEVLDFGTTGEGTPFLVMEWLEGEPLDARLHRSPPLTLPELTAIVSEVLSGLTAVHAAGVIHRDIKPSNLYLVTDSEGVHPKIVDFGVSRLQAHLLQDYEGTLTDTGQIVGSPI